MSVSELLDGETVKSLNFIMGVKIDRMTDRYTDIHQTDENIDLTLVDIVDKNMLPTDLAVSDLPATSLSIFICL